MEFREASRIKTVSLQVAENGYTANIGFSKYDDRDRSTVLPTLAELIELVCGIHAHNAKVDEADRVKREAEES